MTRIGLKLFYLRSREKQLSQQAAAAALRVRQATLSSIEQGISHPTYALLIELCRFFDVTPTYLMDDDREIPPLPAERWAYRNALVTVGMWIEVRPESILETPDGRFLCPLLPGEAFYDEEAFRRRAAGAGRGEDPLNQVRRERRRRGLALARALEGELKTHPLRRSRQSRQEWAG